MMESTLTFEGYCVKKMNFVLGEHFGENVEDMEISVEFNRTDRTISKSEKTTKFTVQFDCVIGDKNNDKGFYMELSVVGYFSAPEKNKQYVANACTLLFPYMRSAVANLCTTANIPAFYLPVINPQMFFEKEK